MKQRISKAFRNLTTVAVLCFALRISPAQGPLPLQWIYSPITQPTCAVYSPDGALLAVTGSGGTQVYAVPSNKLIRCFQGSSGETSLAFSSDCKTLAGGSGGVHLWDVSTGKLLHYLQTGNSITSVAFSPDGKSLATTGNTYSSYPYFNPPDCKVYVWNVETGGLINSVDNSGENSTRMAFSPDGSMIALCLNGPRAQSQILSAKTLKPIVSLQAGANNITSAAFSPDGKTLAGGGSQYNYNTYSASGVLELWNVSTGNLLNTLPTASTSVNSVQFSPDGKTLADGVSTSSSYSGNVELWSVSTGALITTLDSPTNDQIDSISFSPDGKFLATCGLSLDANYSYIGELDVWNVQSEAISATIPTAISAPGAGIAFSPDGGTIATGGNQIDLWNAGTGFVKASLKPSEFTSCLAFSSDGKMLAEGGYSTVTSRDPAQLEIWSLASGKLAKTFPTPAVCINSIALSSDSTFLAAGGYNNNPTSYLREGDLELWSVANCQLIFTLPTSVQDVFSVSLSADGTMLAACGTASSTLGYEYGVLEIWDISSGSLITSLETGILYPDAVAFSPIGKLLAIGGLKLNNLSGLELWDVSKTTLVSDFPDLTGSSTLGSIAFSPDGALLFTGSSEGLLAFNTASCSLLGNYTGRVDSLAISPTGTQLILRSWNQLEAAANPSSISMSLGGLTLSPGEVAGGNTSTGSVSLSKLAPSGGVKVKLSSSSKAVTLPASVFVPSGSASATFKVSTIPNSVRMSATITGELYGISQTATLIVDPPALSSLALKPASIKGGKSCIGTVSIDSPAPAGGISVSLASANTNAVVPKTVVIPAGRTSANFTVKTKPVHSNTSATITATFDGISQFAVLKIS